MEKIINFIGQNLNNAEFLGYFSVEILCILGIILNLFMYLFFNKKCKIKKISDIITGSIFGFNSIFLFALFLKNKIAFTDFSFSLLRNTFVFCNDNILFKFLINLFFVFFILCMYKTSKKAKFGTTIMNACLLFLSLFSGLLIQVENSILAFVLLDLCAFFIYKYASNMRLRKSEAYSLNSIAINTLSTILFYGFFFLLFVVQGQFQIAIVQTCCACALFLKAGLFPIYNYTLAKEVKNNISYSALLCGFLPMLGVISFVKFSQNINFSSDIYFVALVGFLIITMIFSSLSAYKTKNLSKYFANCACVYNSYFIIYALISQNNKMTFNMAFMFLFVLFALYALICVLKINLKSDKLNMLQLKGMFVKNKEFVNLFAISLLILVGVIPSALFFNNLELIKEIYSYDKTGSYICIAFVFSNLLVLINALNLIKACFSKKELKGDYVFLAKRTTINYVVPALIITFLIIGAFL